MSARKSAGGRSKAGQSSRQSSVKPSSSQHSHHSEHNQSRQSSAKTNNTRQRFKLPQFKTRSKDTQRIDPESSMYNEEKLGFSQKDIHSKKKGIESDLSLFAPHATEIVPGTESEIIMERPVTPIDREIRRQPYEWEQMSQYVRRRVAPDKKVEFLSLEDQTDLSEILVAEVYHIWPEIKRQIDDPFLSWQENIELNRRIAVHIVTVCEQLYKHYLKKAKILMKRGVFSGPANMSRLKAQLGIEASKYFNVLIIRRYIVADMKGDLSELESVDDATQPKVTEAKKPGIPQMSFKGMLKKSRPKKEQTKRRWKTPAENIQEIKDNMPELETSKLLSVLLEMPKELLEGFAGYTADSADGAMAQKEVGKRQSKDGATSKEEVVCATTEDLMLKRSNSAPELHIGENMLQELGIVIEKPFIPQKTTDTQLVRKHGTNKHHSSIEVLFDGDENKKDLVRKGKFDYNLSRDVINRDLQSLTEVKKEPPVEADADDLPPLLQAIIRHSKHDGKEEEYKKVIAELEEKERREMEERSAPLRDPQYPQPATVAQKMSNKTIVRTSDIRVSERICMENVTIKKHHTVYNDLLDEIDSTMVKNLDANLFLGDEIREVYTEIMKTVPRDHLDCEQDDLIEKAPEGVDLTGLMASSSLTMRRVCDRMINPQLKVRAEAPWGSKEDKAVWSKTDYKKVPGVPARRQLAFAMLVEACETTSIATKKRFLSGMAATTNSVTSITPQSTPRYMKSCGFNCISMQHRATCKVLGDPKLKWYGCRPLSPPKDSKGAAHFDPLKPSSENIAFASDPQSGRVGGIMLSDLPTMLAERMARSYASWLTWWKGTIDGEDYMKYLSTLETDYLGVINHFYDSDAEDDEDEESKVTKMDDLNKELEEQKVKKLNELRGKKQEYTSGMWNAQTVLLGGLGKDPDVEDDEDIGRIKSAIDKEILANQSKKKILGDVLKDRVKSANMTAASQSGGLTPRTAGTASRGFTSGLSSAVSGAGGSVAGEHHIKTNPSFQDRMENVWSSLHIPDGIKLDMAIKYSSDFYVDSLEEVISAWEAATSLIVQREQIISELEAFERLASDPNRFFESGYRGSSVARLEESKIRTQLRMKLENIHQRVEQAVCYVNETYNDTMTYQGRPYLDKMKWDRTEMLYWLQEERKQHALDVQTNMVKKQNLIMTPIAQN